MHVAFDPQTFSLQPYGGISRYFLETALSLARLPDTQVSVLAFAHINAYLTAARDGAAIGFRVPVLPEPLRPFLVRANQALARRWLARNGADLVHETYYSHARSAPAGVPTVLTVFDMIHEKFPDYAPRTARVARAKRAAIARADHVICISENTRRDLLEIHGIDSSRASVVTLGFSLQRGADAEPAQEVPLAPGKRRVAEAQQQVLAGEPGELRVGACERLEVLVAAAFAHEEQVGLGDGTLQLGIRAALQ